MVMVERYGFDDDGITWGPNTGGAFVSAHDYDALAARLAEAEAAAKTWENEAERRSRRYEKAAVRLAEYEKRIQASMLVRDDLAAQLAEQDFEYNRKTNALIERHAGQIEGLLARLAEVEHALNQARGVAQALERDNARLNNAWNNTIEAHNQTAARLRATEAIAAADGTLHGAIDHWQERATKAEARGAILDQYGDCGHGMIYQYGGGPCLACNRDALVARLAEALRLLRRYRTETPLGHQPHMIAHEADAVLRTADSASDARCHDCYGTGEDGSEVPSIRCGRCNGTGRAASTVDGVKP